MNEKTNESAWWGTGLVASLLTVVPLLTSSFTTAWVLQHETWMRTLSTANWLLITIVCTVAAAFALAPPTFLAVVFGYFLGWQALPFLILMNLAAIGIVYVLTGFSNRDAILRQLSKQPRIQRFLSTVHQNEWRFVFFAKLSPILPFALTNFLFGLLRLRLRNVWWGGFLGMIPRTVLAVWVGQEANNLRLLLANPNESVVSRLVVVGLVLLSCVGLLRFFQRGGGARTPKS